MMRHRLLFPLAALAALALAPAARAHSDHSSGPAMERMQHWTEDRAALLDAGLAGLKAGLTLTPDQEKLWPPFEAAVRDAAKLRTEHMKSMMERMRKMHEAMAQGESGEGVSPIDRLEALGRALSDRGAAIEKVADAAKPLYASLDDSQKRRFGLLARRLIRMQHPHHGMGMMHERMMRHGGMGREDMDRDSESMERMGHGSDDEHDNSDEQ